MGKLVIVDEEELENERWGLYWERDASALGYSRGLEENIEVLKIWLKLIVIAALGLFYVLWLYLYNQKHQVWLKAEQKNAEMFDRMMDVEIENTNLRAELNAANKQCSRVKLEGP